MSVQKLNHKHLIVSMYVKNPPKEPKPLEIWLRELVDIVNMKILMGPYSIRCETLGNVGCTAAVVIETSHISLHSFETDTPFIKFDLYSCDDFSVEAVLKHLDVFGLISTEHMLIDRNDKHDENGVIVGKSMVVMEHVHRTY